MVNSYLKLSYPRRRVSIAVINLDTRIRGYDDYYLGTTVLN